VTTPPAQAQPYQYGMGQTQQIVPRQQQAGQPQQQPTTPVAGDTRDPLVASRVAPPSLAAAFRQQFPQGSPAQYQVWVSEQVALGNVAQDPASGGYQPTQAFYQSQYGWTPGANGGLVNTQTQGGQALSGAYAQQQYTGMGPYGYVPRAGYGFTNSAYVPPVPPVEGV
jgi:hypothetical protein